MPVVTCCGHALVLEDAGEDAHRVRLLALGDEFRLARTAAVQIGLDVGFGEGNARRTAIDHAADAPARGFRRRS